MNLFTNLSRKGVAKRFVFLFLTLLTFSFTSNAQIPTFTEILEQYYNAENIVLTANRATPYGEQLENYDFESWENEGKETVEPTQWNSFMTAETASSSLNSAKSQQMNYSTEIRPNSSGSRSARIYAREINLLLWKIIANGNMTNGKIYAGSTTANDDKNYNFTSRSDANFNTAMTSIPDSLTVWVAFRAKNAVNAKITTTIHGDTDLKQLAKNGNSPADMVCAVADVNIPRTSASGAAIVWKRVTVPFAKKSHDDPRYILVTFNTNETAGEGAKNDELFVDDACLIYNPVLGLELLAQTEYVYPSQGSSVNISIPFNLEGSMSVYNLNAAANEVIAQLSDANGSFANPTELGRMTTDVSGTINGVIPAGLPEGTGYRVRVVSTNYPMTSEDNGTDITIRYYAPKVEIALGNVATKSATATFTPNADCAEYYFLIAKASESIDAAYVKANGEKQTATFTKTFEGLTSNTKYVIYALPVSTEGNNGELKTLDVTTGAFNPQIEMVLGNVAAKSVSATFTPKTDCAEYYFLIAKASESVNVAYVKANGEKKNAAYTKTWEGLTSNTAYVVYVLPIDAEGNNGTLKTLSVTTGSFNPQIEITRDNVAAKSITATLTPNADCAEYYFLIAEASESIDAEYVKANGEKQTATFTKTFEGLTSNTAYTIYALMIDADGFSSELKSVNVTTKAFVPQVEINRGNVLAKSIAATFVPNEDCAEYYFLIVASTETADSTYIRANGERQTETFAKTFENLMSNTEYAIYVLPVDADGFNGEVKSVNIKTKALAPQVEIAKGNVLPKSIAVTFNPNADCAEYYVLIAASTETIDAEYVKANGENHADTVAMTFENLMSNTEYTIGVLPIDVEGKEGDVTTLAVKTKSFAPYVEIVKGNIAASTVEATFNPNADCAEYYILIAESAETVDAEYIKTNGEKQTDTLVKTFENLVSNTEYTVYALPVDVEGNSFAVKTAAVKTQAYVPAVAITDTDATTYTVEATFTPNADCAQYYIMSATAAEMEQYESEGLSKEEVVRQYGINKTSAETYVWEDKSPMTEYTIYALPVDKDGNVGRMSNVVITTNVVAGTAAVTFNVEVLSETSIIITANPNAETEVYYYVIVKKAEADAMTDEDIIQMLENGTPHNAAEQLELTVEPETEYCVVVSGKNVNEEWGPITKVGFVSKVAGPSVIEIEVEELSTTLVKVTATPNEDTKSYHYIVKEKAEVEELGIETVIQMVYADQYPLQGITQTEWPVKPNTYYYVIACGKNTDDKWGEVAQKEFVVIEEAGAAVVELVAEVLSPTSVSIVATPNEDTEVYHYIVMKKADADAIDDEAIRQQIVENGNPLYYVEEDVVTIESNVPYYAIACGKNADGVWGEMTKIEFMAEKEAAGPASVEISVEELSETSVEITATPNGNTVLYHYILIEKEEADAIGEDAVMQKLNENENYLDDTDVWTWTIKSNVAYYVVAQAKNADEIWGEVTKVEFMVEKEPAGPASVEISVEVLSETSVEVTATPNENTVSYHYIIIKKEEADAMGEDAVMQKLNENGNYLDGVDVWTWTIETNVAYYVVAQAKNADEIWGEVTKVEFMAEQKIAAIDIIVNELEDTKVSVKATPNEKATAYHYIVMKKAEADTIIEDVLVQMLNDSYNYFEGVSVMNWIVEMDVPYYVIVRAKDAYDVWGEIVKVEFRTVPPALVDISVKELSETTVGVTAAPNRSASAYHYTVVEKALADSISGEEIMQLPNVNYFEGFSMMTWTVEPNVAYYVVAQAKDAYDVWGEITKVEFIIGEVENDTTNVAELDNTMLEIYPNPASEYVRINSDVNIDELVIYSIDGKVVYAESVNQQETMIDVSGFAQGSYVVRMISGKDVIIRRIIIKN